MTFQLLVPCYKPLMTRGQTEDKNFALCPVPHNRKSPWGKDLNVKTLSFPLLCGDIQKIIVLHLSPAIPHPSPLVVVVVVCVCGVGGGFKPLAFFCDCAGRFVLDLVRDPTSRFSCDVAR